MKLKNYKPAALMAADEQDLEVVSAMLQDSVAKLGDMTFIPGERRFAFVANRFVWEDGTSRRVGPFSRVRAGVHFDDVTAVRSKNLRLDAKDAVVDILSVAYKPHGDAGGTITLTLAGGGAIAVDVEAVNATLRDISEPWRTRSKPDHEAT